MATALSKLLRAGEETLPSVVLRATRSIHRTGVTAAHRMPWEARGFAVSAAANMALRGIPWYAAGGIEPERHVRAGVVLAFPRFFASAAAITPEDVVRRRLGKDFTEEELTNVTTLLASVASKADVAAHPDRRNDDAFCNLVKGLPSRKSAEQFPFYVQAIKNIATLRDAFGLQAAINLAGEPKSKWKVLGKKPLSEEDVTRVKDYIQALSDEFGVKYLREKHPRLNRFIDDPAIQEACFQTMAEVVTRGTTMPRLVELANRWERNRWSLEANLACVEKVAAVVTSDEAWNSLLAKDALPENKMTLDDGSEAGITPITSRVGLSNHAFHVHNCMRNSVRATSMEAQFRLGQYAPFDLSIRGQRFSLTLEVSQEDDRTTVSLFELKGKHSSPPSAEASRVTEELISRINEGKLALNPDFSMLDTDLRPDNADNRYLCYLAMRETKVLPKSFPADAKSSDDLYLRRERSEVKFRDSNYVSVTEVDAPHFLGEALHSVIFDIHAMDRRRRFPQPVTRVTRPEDSRWEDTLRAAELASEATGTGRV